MRIPPEMEAIITNLQEIGFKSAIVAGGAPRDIYHNKPIKDIDVYLCEPSHNSVEINWGLLPEREAQLGDYYPLFLPYLAGVNTLGADISTTKVSNIHFTMKKLGIDGKTNSQGPEEPHITKIWELVAPNQLTMQFMFVDISPIEFIENYFDVGLCMCYYDGNQLHYTTEFLHDTDNKQFTICGKSLSEQQIARSLQEHIPRLKTKYGWTKIELAPHIEHRLLIKYA